MTVYEMAIQEGRYLTYERLYGAGAPKPIPDFLRPMPHHAAFWYAKEDEARVVNWLGDRRSK